MLDAFFFYAFALLTLGGAMATVTLRNPVHCALGLTGSLFGVAGVFLLQGAEFLSVAQIIVYVGGIMVLFLFVIMLVSVHRAIGQRQFARNWGVSVASAAIAGAGIVYLAVARPIAFFPSAPAAPMNPGTPESVGSALLITYLLPFEIASVLLLAALVGSVVIARRHA